MVSMRSQEGQIMPVIQITDLQKSFGAARVLKSISLNVEEGEMVALIGSSGSGKIDADAPPVLSDVGR